MSTRCNVLVDNNGKMTQYYHHCDGYPEGVGYLLCLARDMALLNSEYHFKEYKRQYQENELEANFKKFLEMTDTGRFEQECESLHGDIEYLYYVSIRECGIKVTYSETTMFWDSKNIDEKDLIEKARSGKELDLAIVKAE